MPVRDSRRPPLSQGFAEEKIRKVFCNDRAVSSVLEAESLESARFHFCPDFLTACCIGACFFGSGSITGISKYAGATLPAFQSGNDNVTLAMPLLASSGTLTGPWNRHPQHRPSEVFNLMALALPGNSISKTGFADSGISV
jgi:hypothetical protein